MRMSQTSYYRLHDYDELQQLQQTILVNFSSGCIISQLFSPSGSADLCCFGSDKGSDKMKKSTIGTG